MKVKMKFLLVLLFCVSTVSMQAQDETKLVLGGSYFIKPELLTEVAGYLSSELNMDVEVRAYDATSKMQSDMDSHAVDILMMNSYGYVYAHAKYPEYSAFAALGKDGKLDSYQSCIITKHDSKITNLEQLKEYASEVDMRFVHPTSTSGHIVPRYELRKAGITQAEMEFKSVELTGSQETAILQVVRGEATVAACGFTALEQMEELGKINSNQYQVIWTSHDIQGAPLVLNEKLSDNLKAKIKDAFISLDKQSPELMTSIRNSFHSGESSFIAVTDKSYDIIRNMASSMDDLILFLNFYLQ